MSSASEPEVPLPSLGNEESYATVVAFARREAIDSHTVARLALHLAESGERLVWSDGSKVADVASTGGPGSLSTLLCPLITRVLGYQVVKLAVPGRPAGAIDSFGTLPGYKTTLSSTEVRRVVEACGFAHFLADARFAPLDAELFQYRRRTGAVAVPMLAASSLLSKKLAVGVNTVGLDVRVGLHGNFGRTIEAARVNARLFCEAAALLGIRATAFLTGGTGPVQPFIGRGEALLALAYACGVAEVEGNEWLSEHVRDCLALTERTVAPSMVSGADSSTHKVSSADVLSVLTTHLRAQGSSIDAFESRVHAIWAAERTAILAPSDGLLTIDLDLIRSALVKAQDIYPASFSDPAGLQLVVRPGKAVRKGDILALLRWEPTTTLKLPEEVAQSFKIASKEDDLNVQTGGMEIVHG